MTIAAGSKDPDVSATFTVPTVYYGAFAGDLDDGTNAFKQWYARKRALGRRLHLRIQVINSSTVGMSLRNSYL